MSLLMAYALNLDPRLHLQSSLPVPVVSSNRVGMIFYGVSAGITYSVETSEDLQTWVTTGVLTTAPQPDGSQSASVDRDSPRRFLRLVVTK